MAGIFKRVCATSLSVFFVFAATATANPTTANQANAGTTIDEFRLPMSFELNEGQAQPEITALTRGKGYGVLLTADEFILALTRGSHQQQSILRFKMLGGNAASKVSGLDALPGTVSYFVGNDRSKWRSGIRTYAKIKYDAVYPGIDLIYYGNQRELEYDFVVRPGADPSTIRFQVSGARKVRLTEDGDLAMDTPNGTVLHHKPSLYQEIGAKRRAVEGRFVVQSNQVSFEVGEYDRERQLVIDPSLSMFTYFGGTGTDEIKTIAVTSPSGLTFFGGLTISPTLPAAANTYLGGAADGFISATNANGTAALLTLFIGGDGADVLNGLALDPAPIPTFLAVAGITNSANFPIQNAAQPTSGGSYDAFVTKFQIALVGGVPTVQVAFSTYLGGGNVDLGNAVAVSNSTTGSGIFVAGSTLSANFPTSNAYDATKGGAYDAFLVKYNSDGTVAYSTFLGGAGSDQATGVAVYNQASPTIAALPFVTGTIGISSTQSIAFVFSLNASGSALNYSKVLGALTSQTAANGIAVDFSGNAYITGQTNDPAFPVVNATQPTYGGNTDAFVAKLDPTGATLFASYYGGTGLDRAYGIAVDTFTGGNNNIFLTGLTTGDFPATAVQTTYGGGGADAFVVLLNGATYAVTYATYLGGTGVDVGYGICVGSQHNARVGGITNSPGLATAGVMQSTIAGGYDGFIARLTTAP